MNLREQHDAFEFFNCLVDTLDEGLKTFECHPVLSNILGGAFADQKICKGCPHRLVCEGVWLSGSYSVYVDIQERNHSQH